MATANLVLAFTAFETQLKTLCLKEFPCGIGTWKENYKKKHTKRNHSLNKEIPEVKFPVTLKDYGSNYEKTEVLDELIKSKNSPWNLDYSWSEEAKSLREIAVRSPWLIDEKFVLAHFKTLRIVDKKISQVDHHLMNFPNLYELTLSANLLRTINSENLPPNLQVLELCANEISNLADLCIRPPALQHLGLGHNLLTVVDDYITGEFWPYLLSLDLSHNNVCDLMDIVQKLQTLPKLRNLILQGNPLSLVPGYRGYVVDSLKKLSFLDDISISADERHHYKGLASRREFILEETKMHLHVDFIKGLLQPEEMKNPDEYPEYPIITRKYYVEFLFLEKASANADIFRLFQDEEFSDSVGSQTARLTEDAQTVNTGYEMCLQPPVPEEGDTDRSQGLGSQLSQGQDTQRSHDQMTEVTEDANFNIQPESDTTGADTTLDQATPGLRLAPIKSEPSTWQEEVELNWHRVVTRDDLLAMRNFLKTGMDVSVMEEKVLSYPVDQVQDGVPTPTGSQKGKDKGKDKKDKKDDKKKGKKSASSRMSQKSANNTKKDEAPKKKKKKGEPDVDMTHLPPEYTTLMTVHVPLEDMLIGETEFENVYTKFWQEDSSGTQTPVSDIAGSKDKKKKEKKKEGKEKDARKSPKVARKKSVDKGDKGKAKVADTSGEEEPPPPPPPLQVHIKVGLHQWQTAYDSVKEEQERAAALAEENQQTE